MTTADQMSRPRKGLEHKTIASAVASELRRRIVSGHFAGGFQLRQDMLARELGVSRVPVREALVLLEGEGLVVIHPHRGAVVSAPSIEEIREVFDLRELLEPRLLLLSAPSLTPEDFAELRQLSEQYIERQRAGDVAACSELNTAFHLGLYRHAAQPKTLGMVAGLLRDSERHTLLQLRFDSEQDSAMDYDGRILALCEEGKFTEAAELMREHVRTAATNLLASLKQMAPE
jgi:DNA-binding GntR family transcriptional regulator